MFPIAWAIVERENLDSWRWFIELLVKDLEGDEGYGWTIMSDQQKVYSYMLLLLCSLFFAY